MNGTDFYSFTPSRLPKWIIILSLRFLVLLLFLQSHVYMCRNYAKLIENENELILQSQQRYRQSQLPPLPSPHFSKLFFIALKTTFRVCMAHHFANTINHDILRRSTLQFKSRLKFREKKSELIYAMGSKFYWAISTR